MTYEQRHGDEIERLHHEKDALRAEVERLKVLASHNSMPTCMEGCDSPALYCDCLKLQVDALKAILKKVEYVNDGEVGAVWCPVCWTGKPAGHSEDCELGHALHGAFPASAEKRVDGPHYCCNKCGYGGPLEIHPGCNYSAWKIR